MRIECWLIWKKSIGRCSNAISILDSFARKIRMRRKLSIIRDINLWMPRERTNPMILRKKRRRNRATRYQMENWKKGRYKKMSRFRKRR